MKFLSTTVLWVTIILTVIFVFLLEKVPMEDGLKRLDQLPLKGEEFFGKKIALTPMEESVFQGCNLIKRFYSVDGVSVFVTVVDGTKNRNAVHDPTLCFVGEGWKIDSQKKMEIEGGDATIITISKGIINKEVALWFSEGEKKYGSPMTYWLRASLRRLTLGYSGEEPLRVMVQPVAYNRTVNWKEMIEKFPELMEL